MVNKQSSPAVRLFSALSLPALFLFGWSATAQISVLTQHYDIARTGANTSETILTPANVNTSQFGKLFSYPVDGYVYAQPLYVPGVTMGAGTPQAGTKHNVVFVATENDSVYAFDADSNSPAANASPLWRVTLLDAAHGAAPGARVMLSSDITNQGDIVPVVGITSTPVIDPATGTLYVVGKTKENNTYVQRLHALSITNGAEKFGGPVKLQASVQGTGTGSVGGTLNFDPYWQHQRPGLLLLHGIVYIGFGAHEDLGPWHGWILAYNAATLLRTGVWCSTPNGSDGGIWAAGTGLAADVPDPTGHPFGRLFASTGNGSFNAAANYKNFGDSVLRLDLANGAPTMTTASGTTVGDAFTPLDQAWLDNQDLDQGSGGTMVLPSAASGSQRLLVQAGKTGRIYVVNRDSMGGYHPTNKVDPQQKASVTTVYSAPAYWNGRVYFWASGDHLRAYSFANGVMSSTSTSASAAVSNFPGSTPTISSNANANGIVWNILSQNYASKGHATLDAHDASNVAKFLYSSDQNLTRDNPGAAVKFTVPTVANGKVYVGTETQLSVYGLLNGLTQAAAPVISPASQSFTSSVTVTMTDSTPGAVIHFTTDGTTATAASPSYMGPLTVTTTQTIRAIATAAGYLDSNITTSTYTRITRAAMPTFNPAPGSYSSTQQVTISSTTSGAIIYYTTDGSTPATNSTKYTAPVTISVASTLKAIATAANLTNSAVASGVYTIQTGTAAARPSFGPAPGTYATPQNVSMFSTTAGATIYYTTDGSTPTSTSNKYTGPVNVSTTTTLKAIATAPNFTNSTVSSATYTIQNTATASPTFSPVAGTYSSTQQVTITSTTSGATIYYTTDGSTPTTASNKYTAPVTISATTTLKAIATAPNLVNSALTTGVYTIQTAAAASPTFSPAAGTYSSTQQVTISSTTSATIYYTTDGSTPTTASNTYTAPVTISTTTTLKAIATATNLANSAVTSGVYTIQTAAAAAPIFSPAPGTYSIAQQVTITTTTSGATIYYTTDGSTPTTASTQYTGPVTISTAATLQAMATAPNLANSAISSGVYTIQTASAARPSFSPAPGTYTGSVTVSIFSTTAGATMYYTTDGTTPTSASNKYTGPVTLTATTTLKAIATAPNLANSAVSNAPYTIN